jgi:hypothetical protein
VAEGDVTITLNVTVASSSYTVPDGGITSTCSIPDYDDFDISLPTSGNFLKGYTSTGNEQITAPAAPGDVTVSCTVTVKFSNGQETRGDASASFTVVACNGNAVTTPNGDERNDGAYLTQDYTLSISPPSGVSFSQTSPTSGTSQGITGDPGVTDCKGCPNTTQQVDPSAVPGSAQVSGGTVSITWTLTQEGYDISEPCVNNPDWYEEVEPQAQDPQTPQATAYCSQ